MIYLLFLLIGIVSAGYFDDVISFSIIIISALCFFVYKRKELSIKKIIVLLLISAIGFSYYLLCDFIINEKYSDVNIKNTQLTITVLTEPDYSYNTLRFEGKVEGYGKKAIITLYDTPYFSCYDELKLNGSIFSMNHDKESYYSKGIYYKVTSFDKNITISRGKGFLKIVSDFKKKIIYTIDSIFSGNTAMFIKGIMIGDDRLRSKEIDDALMKLSLSHIVSISGMHFSIITMFILFILRRFYIKRKITSLITIPISFLLAIFIGFTPSIVRVLITITILSLADLFNRDRVNDTYLLLLVAVIMLIFNVYYIYSVAFILSFTSLAGILIYTKKIALKLKKLPTKIADIISVTISAGIITLPFVIYYFKGLPVLSLLANVIAVPLIPFIMIYAIVATGISMVCLPLGQLISIPLDIVTKTLLYVITTLGKFKYSYFNTLSIEKYYICIYFAALFVIASVISKHKKIIISTILLMFFAINIFYPLDSVISPYSVMYAACGEDSGKAVLEHKDKTVFVNSSSINKMSFYEVLSRYNKKFDVYIAFDEKGVQYFIDNSLHADKIYIPAVFYEAEYFISKISTKCNEIVPLYHTENIHLGEMNLTLNPKDEYNIYDVSIEMKNKKIIFPGEQINSLDSSAVYVLKYYSLDKYKDCENVLNCFENKIERIKI